MRQVMASLPGVVVAVLLTACCGCSSVQEQPGGKTSVNAEKGKVTLDPKPGGAGGVTVETNTGKETVEVGANATVRLPSWLPACPNGTIKMSYSDDKAGSQGGVITWTTTDSPQKAYQFYEKALRDAGLSVSTMTQDAGVSGGVLMAQEVPDKRRANVAVSVEKSQTVVQVGYILK